jgi:hypothetical protein
MYNRFGWFNHSKPRCLLVKPGILDGEIDQAHATKHLTAFNHI